MKKMFLIAASLAAMLTGCPYLVETSRGPIDNAPWNDPYRDRSGGSSSNTGMVLGNGPCCSGGYSLEYHYVWIEGPALRIKFRGPTFQTKRVLEHGGGYDEADLGTWGKVLTTDSSGYGLGRGSYLMEDRGHALEYFVLDSAGWRNGEKFRITLSRPGVLTYIDTVDVIAGPGVRAYDREKLIVDKTKFY